MHLPPFFVFLAGAVFVGSTEAHFRVKSFKYKDNHKSDGRDILQTLSVSSAAKCAYQCTANKDCDDANFNKAAKDCQLLKKKPDDATLRLVEQPGLLYIGNVKEGMGDRTYDVTVLIREEVTVYKPFPDDMEIKEYERIKEHSSCKTIYDSGRSTGSKVYNLTFGINTNWSMVYCIMDPITGCGPGGWTLVMKVDGTKQVFNYDSPLWTNKQAYNEYAGQTGTESLNETKMPSFWRTPFTKVCLGMKSRSGGINWMTINKTADSMLSLFESGTEIPTTLGTSAWLNLFPDHALQPYRELCKEGFNTYRSYNPHAFKIRIGKGGDDVASCMGADSYLGVGTQSRVLSVSCGSSNTWGPPAVAVPSNCFIFVQ